MTMFVTLARDQMAIVSTGKSSNAVTAYSDMVVESAEATELNLRVFSQDTMSVYSTTSNAGDGLLVGLPLLTKANDSMVVESGATIVNRSEVVANTYIFSNKDVGIRLDDESAFKHLEARQTFFWG